MMVKTSLPTTEMQVTSIRFERELIEQLKTLSAGQGYQALVRDILWDYVHQNTPQPRNGKAPRPQPQPIQARIQSQQIQPQQIRATLPAQAQRTEYCALTGQQINPQESMWFGVTTTNEFVPLSQAGLAQVQHQNEQN
jgi:hypothetical protein